MLTSLIEWRNSILPSIFPSSLFIYFFFLVTMLFMHSFTRCVTAVVAVIGLSAVFIIRKSELNDHRELMVRILHANTSVCSIHTGTLFSNVYSPLPVAINHQNYKWKLNFRLRCANFNAINALRSLTNSSHHKHW